MFWSKVVCWWNTPNVGVDQVGSYEAIVKSWIQLAMVFLCVDRYLLCFPPEGQTR